MFFFNFDVIISVGYHVKSIQGKRVGGGCDPLEQVGVVHGHASDNLLPERGVNPQHGHRAAEKRDVQ